MSGFYRYANETIARRDYTGQALDNMQNRGLTPMVIEHTIQTGAPSPGNMVGTTKIFDPVNRVTEVIDTLAG